MSRLPRIRGPITRALVLLTLSGALCAVIASPASARILKRLDFETGTLEQWSSVQALPGRVSVVRSPVRQGRFASRFVVKHGDHPVPGGERAEAVWDKRLDHAGETAWWRWSTYFPTGFRPNRGGWNIFTQFHQTAGSCPPPVRFQVEHSSGRSRLAVAVWGGRMNWNTCEPRHKRAWHLGRMVRNRWYHFVVKIKWSPTRSHGRLLVRVNGKVRVRAHAATIYKGQSVYVKQGFYRGPSSKTTTIYHDGMQRFTP